MATQMETVRIDKHVAIPERSRFANVTRYPFQQMEVGDSFTTKVKSIAQIYTAAKRANVKATVRGLAKQDKDGMMSIRVWRVQ